MGVVSAQRSGGAAGPVYLPESADPTRPEPGSMEAVFGRRIASRLYDRFSGAVRVVSMSATDFRRSVP